MAVKLNRQVDPAAQSRLVNVSYETLSKPCAKERPSTRLLLPGQLCAAGGHLHRDTAV